MVTHICEDMGSTHKTTGKSLLGQVKLTQASVMAYMPTWTKDKDLLCGSVSPCT